MSKKHFWVRELATLPRNFHSETKPLSPAEKFLLEQHTTLEAKKILTNNENMLSIK